MYLPDLVDASVSKDPALSIFKIVNVHPESRDNEVLISPVREHWGTSQKTSV
jgi:hypothetical protein